MEVSIRVHGLTDEALVIDSLAIERAAKHFTLNELAPGRYSSLFVVGLMMLGAQGIDPDHVIRELRALEGRPASTGTKPATPFIRQPLKGLWHKHFFAPLPSVMAHNILNQFGKGGLANLVNEIFDPKKSSVVTQAMINELAHRATVEQYENRYADSKLTGEWIVFGKHAGLNYYLTIANHETGDSQIADRVRICQREFPFASWLAA